MVWKLLGRFFIDSWWFWLVFLLDSLWRYGEGGGGGVGVVLGDYGWALGGQKWKGQMVLYVLFFEVFLASLDDGKGKGWKHNKNKNSYLEMKLK